MKYYVYYYANGDISAYAEQGYNRFFVTMDNGVVEFDYNCHSYISANWEQVSAAAYKEACLAILAHCDGWRYSIIKDEVEARL